MGGMDIAKPSSALFVALSLLVSHPARAENADIIDYSENALFIDRSDVAPADGLREQAIFRATMIDDHNAARYAVGAAPLIWDEALADDALRYARRMAATRRFAHALQTEARPAEGENLWMGTHRAYSYEHMAQAWIEEDKVFQTGTFPANSRTGKWHDVGHYTQVIWGRTQAVGCAIASNQTDDYLATS